MRWHEITEAARPAYLYHGTGIASLIQGIYEDCLEAGGHYLCFTRDPTVARKFAVGKGTSVLEIWGNDWDRDGILSDDPTDAEFAEKLPLAYAEHSFDGGLNFVDRPAGAIIAVDQTKLRQRYKLQPYCDERDADRDGKWEMEERVYRDIRPWRPYISEIRILGSFERIADVILNGDAKLGLTPQMQYADTIEFIRSKIV